MRSFSSLTFQTRRSGARSKREDWLMALAAEMIHDPGNQRQREAHQKAGHDRKVKAAVPALIGNVSGQAAEPERQARAEQEQSAGSDQHHADRQEQLPE